MRREFEKILGEELRYLAIETRERLGLTQMEMERSFKCVKAPIPNLKEAKQVAPLHLRKRCF